MHFITKFTLLSGHFNSVHLSLVHNSPVSRSRNTVHCSEVRYTSVQSLLCVPQFSTRLPAKPALHYIALPHTSVLISNNFELLHNALLHCVPQFNERLISMLALQCNALSSVSAHARQNTSTQALRCCTVHLSIVYLSLMNGTR